MRSVERSVLRDKIEVLSDRCLDALHEYCMLKECYECPLNKISCHGGPVDKAFAALALMQFGIIPQVEVPSEGRDIVREYWESVNVDTIVRIQDEGSEEILRHFSEYRDGMIHVFADGKSFYTSDGGHECYDPEIVTKY